MRKVSSDYEGDLMNQGRIRLASPVVVGALSLVVAVFVSSTGMLSSLSNALTNRIQDSAKKLQSAPAGSVDKQQIKQQMANMPLYFIENQGQMDQKVSHYLQGAGTSVYFTSEGLTYALNKAKGEQPTSRYALKLDFVRANQVTPTAVNKTEAKISYFQGSPDQWKTGVPTSAGLKYSNLWPGIDLVYSGTGQKLKYEFQVAPGADPSKIKLAYRGADSLSVNPKGQLNVATPQGALTDDKPFTYQEIDGKKETITSSYAIPQGSNSAHSFGFSVGNYDRTKPLVIDPAIFIYAGYIGGAGDDQGEDITLDGSGAAYITGQTDSPAAGFPVAAGPDSTENGAFDAFVVKVNPAGTGLVYAGYIGGSGDDHGLGIAVDASGAAYVSGITGSTEATFPVSSGPDLTFNGGGNDGFVAKVSPSGTSLDYAGYIGGSANDVANEIAVSSNNAYIVGDTASTAATFPVTGGPDLIHNGANDGYVAKVNSAGTGLDYAGYVGGSSDDSVTSVAVNPSGAAYLGGFTASTETTFPVAVGPDLTHNGQFDFFVSKVNAAGTALDYAGYIGGDRNELAGGIALDEFGAAYVAATTGSTEATFPETVGPDLTFNGSGTFAWSDAFIAKVNPAGTGLIYAGYIGGSGDEQGFDVAVGLGGSAIVVGGQTNQTGTGFPSLNGPDLTHNGGFEGWVSRVKPDGSALLYSGWVGGGTFDVARGVAVDSTGSAYVTGFTDSNEATFPETAGPDLTVNAGYNDAFVAKVSAAGPRRNPAADFDGNLKTDVSVYRAGTGVWYMKGYDPVSYGGDPSDKAVPGDYNGNGVTDVAVYRTSTGTWLTKDQLQVQWGGDLSDIPVPADYSGDGLVPERAVYRKDTGVWYIQGGATLQWGGDPSDIPVPGDYTGDGSVDIAVYRRATGTWYINGIANYQWGGDPSDVPVPGDYDNNGTTDVAVYRRSTGAWWVMGGVQGPVWGGDPSDVPVPGDYNKDGSTDLAIYRKDIGRWYVMNQFEVSWGGDPTDKALPLPSAIREAT